MGGGHSIIQITTPQIFTPATGVGAGSVLGVFGVAMMVKSFVDHNIQVACHEMTAHRNQVLQWNHFQLQQNREMSLLKELYSSVNEVVSKLAGMTILQGLMGEPDSVRPSTGPAMPAKGYMTARQQKENQELIRKRLEEISALLKSLPDSFMKSEQSPYLLFQQLESKLQQRLSQQSVVMEELSTFQETILRSLKSFIAQLELSQNQRADMLTRTEKLFGNVLAYATLTTNESLQHDIDTIRENLLKLMVDKSIKTGAVEILEKKFEMVSVQVEEELAAAGFRKALADSVIHHLEEMGYTTVQPFSDDVRRPMLTAEMSMPGSERLQIALHRNHKLAFQMVHESGKKEEQLDPLELEQFRGQEKKWCKHLQELMRQLSKDGFEYNVTMEKEMEEKSIPIVVVETADEIAEQERRKRLYNESKKRKLT